MSARNAKRGRLAAAERFAALRILDAQLVQVGNERKRAAEERRSEEIRAELDALDAYRRSIAAHATPLSAAQLEQAILYRDWVTERLDVQSTAASDARRAHEASMDVTRDCVRERSALERACRRRDEQVAAEDAQREQKLLDSHASMKLAAALLRERLNDGGENGN